MSDPVRMTKCKQRRLEIIGALPEGDKSDLDMLDKDDSGSSEDVMDRAELDPAQTSICELGELQELLRLTYLPVEDEIDSKFSKIRYANPTVFYPLPEQTNWNKRLREIATLRHTVKRNCRRDPYAERYTDIQFLGLKCASFFILGKPGVPQTEVARLFSSSWKCVNLNPRTVVEDEIKLGTRIGKCFEFNLKDGRAIRPDVILRLIAQRVKTQTAAHRGFILSGFPIIQDPDVLATPLITESTMLVVTEALDDILPTEEVLAQIVPRKKSEPVVAQPKSVTFKNETDVVAGEFAGEFLGEGGEGKRPDKDEDEKSVEGEGMEEGMEEEASIDIDVLYERGEHEWTLADDIDVGETDEVLIHKVDKNLWNTDSQMEFLFNLFEDDFVIIYLSCDNMDAIHLRLNPGASYVMESAHTALFSTSRTMSVSPTIPEHSTITKSIASKEIREYYNRALPIIEKYIVQNKGDYFLKIDALLPPSRIVEIILTRMKLLNFPPVVIPELLKLEKPMHAEDADECKLLSPENHFDQLRYQNVVSPIYRLQLSDWKYKCPVAATYGKIVKGIAKNAVKFTNRIFFLSSDEALLNFYRNPRPYIQSVDKVSSEIWIMGPLWSGRSTLAHSLGTLLKGRVIDPNHLKYKYRKKIIEYFRNKVSLKALDEGKIALRKKLQEEKQLLLNDWMKKATDLLKEAVEYHTILTSSADTPSERSEEEINSSLMLMDLPPISELDSIKLLLEDAKELAKRMPLTLTEPIEEVDPFHPFVVEYIDKVLQEISHPEVKITPKIYADIIKEEILKTKSNYCRIFEKGTSLIVDGMPIDLEVLECFPSETFPDYTVCLKDNDPLHEFLVSKLLNKNERDYKGLRRFLTNIRNDEEMEEHFGQNLAEHLQKMEQDSLQTLSANSDDNLRVQIENIYVKGIDRFNSRWVKTEMYLQQKCRDPSIVVDIKNKSREEVVDEVMTCLKNKFRDVPVLFTPEEKKKEKDDFIKSIRPLEPFPEVTGEGKRDEVEGEEEVEGEGKEIDNWEELYLASRRFGNTGKYCPVAFNNHNVLWKGKEEYCAKFKEKFYFCSSQQTLELFINNPYNILQTTYIASFPPPRIVVIGARGSGKTTIAKSLSQFFGLHYLCVETFILRLLNIKHLKNLSDALINEFPKILPRHLDIIKDYLHGEGNASKYLVQIILNMFWLKEPYKSTGFILDDFPRRKSDVDLMIANYFIPDIVIELHVTQNDVQSRLFPVLLQEWRSDIREKQCQKEMENQEIHSKWKYNRKLYADYLISQKREERMKVAHEEAKKRLVPTPASSKGSVTSLESDHVAFLDRYTYTEEDEDEDMVEVEEILKAELPEPEFHDEWESEAEAMGRIGNEIDESFFKDIENLDLIRPEIQGAQIDQELIDTTGQSQDYILRKVYQIILRVKNREPTILEDVHEISRPLAEKLLEQGYYFFSKFGRLCPVQAFEKFNPIHMYLSAEEANNIHTIVHRRYIYFVSSDCCRDKFLKNPVKYVMNDDIEFPLLPVRIAIIGPPKCGKTSLAKRFGDEYGLNVITRGSAIRYMLNQFPDAELSKNMRYILEQGWCLTDEMVIRAVEALTMEGKSLCQGYVLDGFPNSIAEMHYLMWRNIIPLVVLDIDADLDKIKECTESCKNEIACAYSFQYIETTHSYWSRHKAKLRDCLRKEYQNIYSIDSSKSKWYVWNQAREIVFSSHFNLQRYVKESKYYKAHLVNSFCITSQEFSGRESAFRNYCPGCLQQNKLHYRESSPDWKNVVLFCNFYYAVCSHHLEGFLREPQDYLYPTNRAMLPKHLPAIVSEVDMVKLHQGGYCIVTFWDSMPKHVLVKGETNFAVRYRKRFCLFCSEECRQKFMKRPEDYFEKKIHFRKSDVLSLCDLNQLPTMGYLEQFVAQQLIEALVHTEAERPYCPGLGVDLSALINIGLYLKLHNPKTRKEILPFLEEALEKFEQRKRLYSKIAKAYKTLKNPFTKII